MLKRILPLFILPLLLAGCTRATLTNLTPQQQPRNPNNLYPVEAAMATRQQTLRWDSIRPQIIVGDQFFPMRPTPSMTNRWEGLIPVPPGTDVVRYRYKFDYQFNQFGPAGNDSAISPEYTLRIIGN